MDDNLLAPLPFTFCPIPLPLPVSHYVAGCTTKVHPHPQTQISATALPRGTRNSCDQTQSPSVVLSFACVCSYPLHLLNPTVICGAFHLLKRFASVRNPRRLHRQAILAFSRRPGAATCSIFPSARLVHHATCRLTQCRPRSEITVPSGGGRRKRPPSRLKGKTETRTEIEIEKKKRSDTTSLLPIARLLQEKRPPLGPPCLPRSPREDPPCLDSLSTTTPPRTIPSPVCHIPLFPRNIVARRSLLELLSTSSPLLRLT